MPPPRLAPALRDSLREGYGARDLRADLLAGCVVGVVAVPLSMALAIASGVAPEHGLATAVVAGGLCALLGGSRVQVSGPTAAFVAVLAPIAAQYGHRGLALATAMAGVLLVAMGLLKLGRLVQFMPYPVTIGFTAGIGATIAVLQLEGFLGLELPVLGATTGTPERFAATLAALSTVDPFDAATGAVTLAVLLAWRRVPTRVPAPLVALPLGALVAWAANAHLDADVATLASRFGGPDRPHGVPLGLPELVAPWSLAGPNGAPGAAGLPSLELLRALLPSALAIAVLAAIESLLSAVIADGMSGRRHDPDAELVAIGAGNLAAPFFGGIAATGAIARTATSVRNGARSPLASVTHALFVLGAMAFAAPALGVLPMASLAALLLVVAWNMSEVGHALRVVRTAPRSDAVVLVSCFGLTVVFDITVAVAVGIGLAAFLFVRRLAEAGEGRVLASTDPSFGGELPPGVLVYEIAGPLFFGAAHKATSQLLTIDHVQAQVVVLDVSHVPVIDATGELNLHSAVDRLVRGGATVLLTGLRPGPRRDLERAGLIGPGAPAADHPTLLDGVRAAAALVGASGRRPNG